MSTENESYEARVASTCQNLSYRLSYEESPLERDLKHALVEAAHALDSHSVRIKREGARVEVVNARGKARQLTIRERLARRLLRGNMEIRP
ncbi:hypothetical protein [Pseudomonas oryzihabitans]|uniref:hypothetical protein n=1 Tax=Pseudomonas oryzihabitans TaxID=47885 RepID=UPI002894DF8F|nr:hypothetical protein [Pseudomonas oryzihabitans]MDT3718482.1 hypothetical protein [Pseudomonas oryzihabitans]